MDESAISQPATNDTRLDWHSTFFATLKAELVDYLDILQLEQEHPLNQVLSESSMLKVCIYLKCLE